LPLDVVGLAVVRVKRQGERVGGLARATPVEIGDKARNAPRRVSPDVGGRMARRDQLFD